MEPCTFYHLYLGMSIVFVKVIIIVVVVVVLLLYWNFIHMSNHRFSQQDGLHGERPDDR